MDVCVLTASPCASGTLLQRDFLVLITLFARIPSQILELSLRATTALLSRRVVLRRRTLEPRIAHLACWFGFGRRSVIRREAPMHSWRKGCRRGTFTVMPPEKGRI